MADSKKYNGSTWEHSLRKLGTATDTITTLPAVIHPTGTTATVGLKGQTLQSSIPSPDNPVMPQGTGERTGNVMPAGELKTVESNGVTFSSDGKGKYTIKGTATAYASARFNLLSAFTTPISVSNDGQGTLSFFNTSADNNVTFVFYNGTTRIDDWKQTPIRRTSTAYNAVGNKYVDSVMITVNSGATVDITITPEFTNDGVLPETFEKFGYKIPISSANTTTPVYLGEVQSTRRIKKYEFTGQEADLRIQATITATNAIQFPTTLSDYKRETFICSHMPLIDSSINPNTHGFAGQFLTLCFDLAMGLDTLEKVRTYLQQQYTNGTPVTVWYVLAEPTTGIVNEPLMRIGDYADTVSGITIPTIAGGDSFDVLTTLKPSEVSLAYTGWHDASVQEWDGSQWNE